MVNNIDDIKQHWSIDDINKYTLSDFGIKIKGGGSGNIFKSKSALWQSRNVIRLFIGTGIMHGVIVVDRIRHKMQVVEDDEKIKNNICLYIFNIIIYFFLKLYIFYIFL